MGIFKAYDIRGIYKEELTKKHAYMIAYYTCKYFNFKEIKIAHDSRESYDELTKYFILGAQNFNTKILYQGMLSTPNFYYTLFEGCSDGVIITASHNPKEYNGFKIMKNLDGVNYETGIKEIEKMYIEDKDSISSKFEEIQTIYDKILLKEIVEELKENNNLVIEDYKKSYLNFLEEFYNKTLTREEKETLKTKKIAFDFGNGMSSQAIKPFVEKILENTIFYNYNIDGTFPTHTPDPSKAKDFVSKTKENFDLLIAFDGDGDRMQIYDENKKYILPDFLITTLIDFFVKNGFGSSYCYDLRVSKRVEEIIEENNLKGVKVRVGRSYYTTLMKKEDIFFGAELSGHFFLKDFKYLDNPDMTFIYLLKVIASKIKETPISEYIQTLKKYYRMEEFNLKVEDANIVMNQIEDKYSQNIVSKLDGISIDLEDVWFNVRMSNTEPVLRFNIEANSEQEALNIEKELKELN